MAAEIRPQLTARRRATNRRERRSPRWKNEIVVYSETAEIGMMIVVTSPCEKALDFGGCSSRPETGSLHPVAAAASSFDLLKRGALSECIDCPASFIGFPNPALPSIFSLPPSGTRSVHAILGAVVPATSRPFLCRGAHKGSSLGLFLPADSTTSPIELFASIRSDHRFA